MKQNGRFRARASARRRLDKSGAGRSFAFRRYMLGQLISLYSFVVLVAVVLSWIPTARNNRFARAVEAVTEPVFQRVRRVVPPMGGFDMSPLIVMIGLQVLRRVLL